MDYNFLAETALFRGFTPQAVEELLGSLGAKLRRYAKGQAICRAGDVARSLGLVLEGRVQIESDDVWGNKSVLDSLGPGAVFAETYACLAGEPMMVSAVAAQAASVLFLNVARLLEEGPGCCAHHSRLIRNLLAISAQKNLSLSQRIFHTSPKSIRGRLLSYLSFQAARSGSRRFTIPFDRQQLADYLSVDRSALSHELGKMQREGLLTTKKNDFCLKDVPPDSHR